MANDKNNDMKTNKDDPRQANEEGDPQTSGRVRGHVSNEQEQPGADRANPDASGPTGKKDVGAAAPHLESGDRA
jgi:hypothetical protein